MYYKKKLLCAASILSYVSCFVYFLFAAVLLSFSNNWFWLLVVLAVASLYHGLLVSAVKNRVQTNSQQIETDDDVVQIQNSKPTELAHNDKIKLIVYTCVGVICLPSGLLCLAALLGKYPEKSVTVIKSKKIKPTGDKPFFKRKSTIVAIVALCAVLVSSFSAMLVETNGFAVGVKNFTIDKAMTEEYNSRELNGQSYVIANDHMSYAVKMYKPDYADEQHLAPVVFVMPGFTRTKETMSQYCVALSRRGAVVFSMDPACQGNSGYPGYNDEGDKISATTMQDGLSVVVQYVYNNTDEFNFIDRNRIGLLGHSQGASDAVSTAVNFAGNSYEESVVKALYFSGMINGVASKFTKLHCNVAMSYAYFDEGNYRYQTGSTIYETVALRFINEVNGQKLGHTSFVEEFGYGNMQNGTYRILHRESTNHAFEMYNSASIGNSVSFFDETLGLNTSLSADNQVWFVRELFNGIALAAAFTFVVALSAILVSTKFFASVKGKRVAAGEDVEAPVGEETVVTARQPRKTHDKIIFWTTSLITAVLACLDYMPLANLSMKWLKDANSGNYTFTFPVRMLNAVMFWAVVNGLIGLILFFGTVLIKNLVIKIRAKKRGETPVYDFEQFKPCRIGVVALLKTILLSLILFGTFYLLVQLCSWMFNQDFRFMMISASALNWRHVVAWLMYIPMFFIFYISNSIRVNCAIGFEGMKEWQVKLTGAIANSIGLVFILVINYALFFKTGLPYYQYSSVSKQLWLYINIVFPLIPMMFLLPILNRVFYNQTNRVYLGALTNCMIFIMMTLSATVNYIPI